MAFDFVLKPCCSRCNSTTDLYGSNCRHMTICLSCAKTMAENRGTCCECGAVVDRLIREYYVRASTINGKNYFIGRFATGLPIFSKKNDDNHWLIQKEGLHGRQVTDALREKYKNKPWLLEDETGLSQYQGQLEGSQSATYYLLMMQGKEFVAIPAGSWYNFNKVAQYKQLTLEEAEEKMKNRRKTADGYQRWMMKAANTGPAAFGEMEKSMDWEGGTNGGKVRKKTNDDDEDRVSDKGAEEDDEAEATRKNKLGLNKKGSNDDDDDEAPKGGDFDLDDDDIDKGDDWEHEEIFTDDDEAVGFDRDEREDLAPEIPAPPEIKQEDDEEEETNDEEGGGLSKSGKELKKLLGRAAGLDESEDEEDDEDDDTEDEDTFPSFLSKLKDVSKEEPADNSPSKPASSAKSAKPKRKLNGDDAKPTNGGTPLKKPKIENEVRSVKDENVVYASNVPSTPKPVLSGPVTADEIRAVLLQKAPVTTQDLVADFKYRLKSSEDKKAFADVLKTISKIQNTNGARFVVLRDR